MGDGFKAHKGPGGQGKNREHPAEGAVGGGIGGREDTLPAAEFYGGGRKAEHHPGEKDDGHNDLRSLGCLAPEAQQRRDHERAHGQQDLAEVDVVARDHVMKAELEHRAQERARNERQGRGVGPDDGHIGDDEEPRAHKAVVVAEDALGVGVHAAAAGITVHEVVVIRAEDQHYQRAEADAERRAHRPRDGEEGGAGHDKGAPAHAAPEGQRPCAEGRQVGLPPVLFFVVIVHSLLPPHFVIMIIINQAFS